MSGTRIYGIKNCDTMKKAFTWLEEHGVSYDFHDYKKHGVNPDVLDRAIKQEGWESVINRRGTTWRALPDDVKESMNEKRALVAALENPSLIKRPLLEHDGNIYLGFDAETYSRIF